MIRSTLERGKKHLVIIDIIRDCNPSPKPSKLWSEYKFKKGCPVTFHTHKFKSSNGRVYELECVKESDRSKIEEIFSRKVATRKVVGKVVDLSKAASLKAQAIQLVNSLQNLIKSI